MTNIGGEGCGPIGENARASTWNRSLARDADAGCRAGAENGVCKARFLKQDLSFLARLPGKVLRMRSKMKPASDRCDGK
jgi:hypothetical protein